VRLTPPTPDTGQSTLETILPFIGATALTGAGALLG
jgi:hypothetical protein